MNILMSGRYPFVAADILSGSTLISDALLIKVKKEELNLSNDNSHEEVPDII
jgi:hypothetical protein